MADDERQDTTNTDASLELPRLRSVWRRGRRPPRRSDAEPVGSDSSQEAGLVLTTTRTVAPRRRRVHVPGPLAALLTGAVVGLAVVGLTDAGLQACSAMRGTSSCGTPGILLVLAIAAVAIVLGSALLRLAGVAGHGSTSFLGVGLLGVLLMLALLPALHAWWIVMAVPLLAMATFLAAWWLTTTYSEPGGRRG